ncbi:hypothetical protein K7G98_24455 [Saccharothrix sp. MB29]|nr:hypothetical protein [Saccharothrix sp. MB29]
MTGTDAIVRGLRVTASVVEVTDRAALERAALRRVDGTDYDVGDTGRTVDEVRAGERERVRGDVGAALSELVDPFLMVDVDSAGGGSMGEGAPASGAAKLVEPEAGQLVEQRGVAVHHTAQRHCRTAGCPSAAAFRPLPPGFTRRRDQCLSAWMGRWVHG